MQDDDGRLVEAIADSWWDEHRRWTLRFNKMRGGIWEAVRTLDPDGPISEENMRVIDLPSKAPDDAEAEFGVMRDDACASSALSAIEREGWKVVPVKPTEDMWRSGDEQVYDDADPEDIWSAMLSAAPEVK